MSRYISLENAIVTHLLEFGSIQENNLQKFQTIDGKVAGFIIKNIGKDDSLQISEIYDCFDNLFYCYI